MQAQEKCPSAVLTESLPAGCPWLPPHRVLGPGSSLSRQDLLAEQAETTWSRVPLPWAAKWRWKGNCWGQTAVPGILSLSEVSDRGFAPISPSDSLERQFTPPKSPFGEQSQHRHLRELEH